MNKTESKLIGIIAEDVSDVLSLKEIIGLVKSPRKFKVKSMVGHGGGRLINKCNSWASLLFKQNCELLIVIHDSDTNPPTEIENKIRAALKPCSFSNFLVCVPIQELEAWLLSDPTAIKKAMKLSREPRVNGNPQDIPSPKEYLGEIIRIASSGKRTYINTVHNQRIASMLGIEKVFSKCSAFRPFIDFIQANISN